MHGPMYIKFFIISRSVLLRMRNDVSDKSRRENQNTHFMFSNFFFKYHAVYENAENFSRAGEVTNDNMADSHFTL